MLSYYGTPIDGQPDTALTAQDGVIPDERQMYLWIKAAFQHFFNNMQKDPVVQVQGTRACRQLLAYLLREIGIQRQRLLNGEPVDDTMLTRLLQFQLGRSSASVPRLADLDPRLVSDLRIAENVMGTIVGAVAGQEEATCRVIDALIRLQEGEYRTSGSGHRYGRFEEAKQLAINVLSGIKPKTAAPVVQYFWKAQAAPRQVLPRKGGARRRADCRQPPAPGGPDLCPPRLGAERRPEPDRSSWTRPREHYLHYGGTATPASAVRIPFVMSSR